MWVVEIMGMRSVESLRGGATPPPSAEPATGEFFITCGDIPDATCAGAAGGATDVIPNRPIRGVVVKAIGSDHYLVSVTFDNGAQATADVAPDATRDIGWSAVDSPAP